MKGRILVHFRSIEDFNVEMKMGLFFFGIEVFSREFKWNQDVGADYWELDQPLLYAVRVEYGARALREAKLFCFFIKGWFSIFGQPRDPFDHNLLCWPLP